MRRGRKATGLREDSRVANKKRMVYMNGALTNDTPDGLAFESSGRPPASQGMDVPNGFLEVLETLTKIQDLKSLYSTIAGIVVGKLAVQHIAVFLYHSDTRTLDLEYSHGLESPNGTSFSVDEALLAWVIKENQSFSSHDILSNSPFELDSEIPCLSQMQTDVGIPLVLSEKVIGLLSVSKRIDGNPLSGADLVFLRQLAAQISICIDNCRLYEKGERERKALNRTLNNLSLLYSIGQAMTYISDLKSLLEYIMNQAIKISNAEKGSIMLYDDDTGELSIRILTGMTDSAYQERINNNEIPCQRFRAGEGVAGQVFQTGKPVFFNDAREAIEFLDPESSFVDSIACIPMTVYGEVLGVINLTNKQDPFGFTDEDIELLKAVADQAAIAVNKAQLWDMAFTDSLTGLYDRRYFKVKLHEELQRAKRYNRSFSIIMADLDNFKDINDAYGHLAGDRTLNAIGSVLKKHIRKIDIIARYGGDEFVMFFPEKGKEAARILAERLKEQISREHFVKASAVSVSIGIASYPEDGQEIEDLIDKADRAMYYAKQRGRNRIESYSNEMSNPA